MEDPHIQGQPSKTWLVESILVTLFCCPPIGIFGIIKASKVEELFFVGEVDKAIKTSQDAAKWTKITLLTGISLWALYLFLWLVFGINLLKAVDFVR